MPRQRRLSDNATFSLLTLVLLFLLCVPIAHAAGEATKDLQLEVTINGQKTNLIAAFKHVLGRARSPATVRLTRGRDIAAACGPLAATR